MARCLLDDEHVVVSIVGFVVINLPPGDFMDAYLARMQVESCPRWD